MYQPVLISNKALAKLNETQRKALVAAGKKAQAFFSNESRKLDEELVQTFKRHQIKVVTLSKAQADQWRAVARDTSYKEFASKVPGGQALIEKALAVQ
jgi:TRAP-type C4-dicarboxylate transport system substrate-binding protein